MSARYYSEVADHPKREKIFRHTEKRGRELVASVFAQGEVALYEIYPTIPASEVAAFVDVLTDCVRRLPPEVQR